MTGLQGGRFGDKKFLFALKASGRVKVKVKVNQPCTRLDRPWQFQQVQAPRFQDNRHKKVVRLSALRTGHLNSPERTLGTHLLDGESNPGPECGIIKNRTRDILACSSVP